MAVHLTSPLTELSGVGSVRAAKLEKLGLRTVGDLLEHYPRQYEDRRECCAIADAPSDRPVCVCAMAAEFPRSARIRRGLELIRLHAVDESGSLLITFFNQPYVRDALKLGETYVFYGKVEGEGHLRTMTNPVFEPEGRRRATGNVLPVYPLTAGVTNPLMLSLVRQAMGAVGEMTDPIPREVRLAHGLMGLREAVKTVHFPDPPEKLPEARRRVIFEELFLLTVGLEHLRGRRIAEAGRTFLNCKANDFYSLLPFEPTGAQRCTMEELARDLTRGLPMNRLVQGDVGSGKTAVAAFGAWMAWKSGFQTALMAPTEILAEQHFQSLSRLFAPTGLRVALLTGSVKGAARRTLLEGIAGGEYDLIVGTHALLSQGVEYGRLGLVVADEQHRFGVAQRAALAAKAGENAVRPHVLVMSATPIPRTLALIVYGDLDVSVMDELPPGRTPIQTFLVGEDKRARAYGFVRKLVKEGRQAYVICPAVEEGDPSCGAAPDRKAVTQFAEELQTQVLPDLRVGLVHGRMKSREKDEVMRAFAAGELDVLVSTTVVEVGVDVPNAALMIVENAERFGLSQLHQLRGRVGRGPWQSYCILMTSTRDPESRARLKVLTATSDGFRIAEEDLRLRGPGDFFGSRQHGLPALRMADLAGDVRFLQEAQEAARELLRRDPGLTRPEHRPLLEKVHRLFAENPDIFN